MKPHRLFRPLLLCAALSSNSAFAIDSSIPYIGGDLSRSLLGDGTGAVIGIVDSGVDDTHPALAGLDSLGNPRMVAEANFVTTESGNTGDDVFGHGTWVASAALSSNPTFTGMAPDARYINARVLNNSNSFGGSAQIRNGIGFAIENGADILNISLNFFEPTSSGTSSLDRMVDWVAYALGIPSAICVGNIASGDGSTEVRSPGSAYNGITVGRTTADFSQVHSDSATAYTADGRMKPDVVAPGTDLTLANDDWEGAAADWDTFLGGCSFATPHVSGLMAQMLEAGATNGLSTNPLVLKANIMNSADKVPDKLGNPWEPADSGPLSVTLPLDEDSGAGQINALQLADQYLAGEMSPGLVDPVGWDLNSVSDGSFIDYIINPSLLLGSTLSATLTWNRHVGRTDDGDGFIDAGDTFTVLQPLSNLDLQLFRDGDLIAESISSLDNVEHLFLDIDQQAHYTLRVLGFDVTGSPEPFSLAWFGSPAPLSLADFNADGFVDGADFSFFLGQWGAPGGLGDADFNSDATVDGADFSFFLGEWDPASPGLELPGVAFIPEPASVTLLSIGALVFIRRNRIPPHSPNITVATLK